jgi:D-amino-acid oxidase
VTGGGRDVLVVGAGVSGLTTAVCLAEAGLRVTIRCAQPPLQTTSAVAGAIWAPHLVESSERATRWGSETMTVLAELVADPAAGVRTADGVVAVRDILTGPAAGPAPPHWVSGLTGLGACDPAQLPPGFTSGWRFTAPLVNMPVYLDYLRGRFENAGGQLEIGTVTSLAEAARERGSGAVLNCTGAAAHDLVPDPAVTPVRGQSVVAENPGLSEFFIGLPDESSELVYVFPHAETVVLGGTAVEGDWSTEPCPAVAERILRDCVAVEPRLAGARVIGHRVGLRPVRPLVRVEAEPSRGQPPDEPLVVHNYGHGGAGITLSWGCARDAARLVTDALTAPESEPRVRER